MVRNPSVVPKDYERSKRERYFLLCYILRQGDSDYSGRHALLESLLVMFNELPDSSVLKTRLSSVLKEFNIQVAA